MKGPSCEASKQPKAREGLLVAVLLFLFSLLFLGEMQRHGLPESKNRFVNILRDRAEIVVNNYEYSRNAGRPVDWGVIVVTKTEWLEILSRVYQQASDFEKQYVWWHGSTEAKPYFFNELLNNSVWTKPAVLCTPLYKGWNEHISSEGRLVYENRELDLTVNDREIARFPNFCQFGKPGNPKILLEKTLAWYVELEIEGGGPIYIPSSLVLENVNRYVELEIEGGGPIYIPSSLVLENVNMVSGKAIGACDGNQNLLVCSNKNSNAEEGSLDGFLRTHTSVQKEMVGSIGTTLELVEVGSSLKAVTSLVLENVNIASGKAIGACDGNQNLLVCSNKNSNAEEGSLDGFLRTYTLVQKEGIGAIETGLNDLPLSAPPWVTDAFSPKMLLLYLRHSTLWTVKIFLTYWHLLVLLLIAYNL